MNFAMNLIWFLLGGGLCALEWILFGCLMCVTVIGIPFGIGAFRIASFSAWPFGREALPAEMLGEERVLGTGCANLIWIVFAGFWLALSHVFIGVVQCVTLILIPWGLQHFKLAGISFAPLGKRIVSKDIARAPRERSAREALGGPP